MRNIVLILNPNYYVVLMKYIDLYCLYFIVVMFLYCTGSSRVVVLNYERYIRVRTILKRLEGSSELSNWLSHPLVLALGGLNIGPNCRLLFAKEVFDYPELEDHELLCNHLGKLGN